MTGFTRRFLFGSVVRQGERRLFDAVLLFGILQGLPLHVGRVVGAAAFEGDDVIDDIAWARAGGVAVGRARMLSLEGTPDGRGAENAAVGVPLAGDAAGAGSPGQGGSQPGCKSVLPNQHVALTESGPRPMVAAQ